ncbi:MAG: glycoside hydrolase family 97 catalytic domain-containing protein [Chitinophagaceae bacterium]
MKNTQFINLLLFVLLAFATPSFGNGKEKLFLEQSLIVESPNGKIRFVFESKDNKIGYSIFFNNNSVITFSSLGLIINGKTWGDDFVIGKASRYSKNETYPFRGIHSKGVNHFNAANVSLTTSNASFVFEVKVFNDGVAFRYVVPVKDSSVVEQDNTSFVLPAESIVWSQSNTTYYEGRYDKKIIDTVRAGERMGPPVTIELPRQQGYACITEGGLTDFAGMSLITAGERILRANLAGATKKKGRVETPWRIIMIGKDLNTLVNNDIISNVSPSYDKKLFPAGYQTAWINPGRSVWSWLSPQRSITLENMKRFSDLAAQLGFEYNLVDEGWSDWKETNRDQWDMMKDLVDYSAKKGVKIWAWKAYPDRKGIPGIIEASKRITFFKKCKEIGIAGLKIDFFDSESQGIIDFYQSALKDAATYQLMINFHGANKPTGESRTWPNEMSREAIRGMENQPPWAKSNTILPFTRYLAGHADYTPVHFGNRMGEVTWSHHVASMIVFTSPFLCIGADPKSILDNPCKQMIQSVPPTWDETIVLPESKIGELVVYARRKGSTWFLAALSSKADTTISVTTIFLPKGIYKVYLLEDIAGKQNDVNVNSKRIRSNQPLQIHLNVNGGFVGRFEKIK